MSSDHFVRNALLITLLSGVAGTCLAADRLVLSEDGASHSAAAAAAAPGFCGEDADLEIIAAPLINGLDDDKRTMVLNFLKHIPVHERKAFIPDIELENIHLVTATQKLCIQTLKRTPTDDRLEMIIQKALPLVKVLNNIPSLFCIIESLNRWSLAELNNLDTDVCCQHVIRLASLPGFAPHEKSKFERVNILLDTIRHLKFIPADEQEIVCQGIAIVGINCIGTGEYESFLRIIGRFPAYERASYAKSVHSLLNGIIDQRERSLFLDYLLDREGKYKEGTTATVVRSAANFINDRTSYSDRRKLINLFARTSFHEHQSFIQSALLLTSGMENEVVSLLTLLRRVPANAREIFVHEMHRFTHSIADESIRKSMIHALSPIPPSLRDDFMRIVMTLQETDADFFARLSRQQLGFLGHVFLNYPPFKEAVYQEWMKMLSTPDPQQVQYAVSSIMRHIEDLELLEEDPLVQEAIRVGTLLATQDDPLNPYHFYQRLKVLREEPVHLNPATLPQETFGGMPVRLNPEYLKALPGITVTYKDLPPYPRDFMVRMKHQIDQRLSDRLTIDGYGDLVAGSLGSPYLNSLLNVQGGPDDVVPLTASKLIAVVAYINSLDDTSSVDSFSEKEHQFLMMLSSIQHCTTGKDGGIEDAYQRLPGGAKYKAISQSKGHAFIEETIREEVEKMFSGTNHFFQRLTGGVPNEEVAQAIHQARYIGNLIKPEVGLHHPLVFDNHTQTLNQRLVALPKEAVVREFYTCFLPHVLLDSMLGSVNKKLSPHNTLYHDLSELMAPEAVERAWAVNPPSIFLTEYGAIHLLLKLGILTGME